MLSGIPLLPTQASTFASEVDNLYFFIVAVTAFFAILVIVLVMYFAIKYRDETGLKVGAPITGSIPLEIGWSTEWCAHIEVRLRTATRRRFGT